MENKNLALRLNNVFMLLQVKYKIKQKIISYKTKIALSKQ